MDWAIDSADTRLAALPTSCQAYFAAASLAYALVLCLRHHIRRLRDTPGAVGERTGQILGTIQPRLNLEAPPTPDVGWVHTPDLYARRDEGDFAGESDFIACDLKAWVWFLEP